MADKDTNCERNVLSAALSLPSEVLCIVFEALQRSAPVSLAGPIQTSLTSLGWLVVTHVCHGWRAVANEHKTLWSYITTTHPELFKLCVERSDQSQLSVFPAQDLDSDRAKTYADMVLEQLDRIKTLHINTAYESLNKEILRAFNATTHVLPILSLTLDVVHQSSHMFPSQFFKLALAPHLCVFELSNARLAPLTTPTNVQVLDLGGNIGLTVSDLLNVLRCLPDLAYFSWNHDGELDDLSILERVEPMIALPHLRFLQLINSLYASALILKSIQAHPQISAYIGSSEELNNPWEDASFVDCLRLYLVRHPMPAAVSVSLNSSFDEAYDQNDIVKMVADFRSNGPKTRVSFPSCIISAKPGFTIEAFIHAANMTNIFAPLADPSIQLLSLLDLHPASWTSLSLCGWFCWTPVEFANVLCHAENVEELLFCDIVSPNENYPPIREMLYESISMLNPRDVRELVPAVANPLFFPKLRAITLEGAAFDAPRMNRGESGSCTRIVESALRERSAVGHPVKEIHLRNCTGIIEEVHLERWRSMFGCIVPWDGKGRVEGSGGYAGFVEHMQHLEIELGQSTQSCETEWPDWPSEIDYEKLAEGISSLMSGFSL